MRRFIMGALSYATIFLLVAFPVLAVGLVFWWRRGPRRPGRTLSLVAVGSAVVISAALLPVLLDDGGVGDVAVTIVPPLALATLVAVFSWWSRTAGVVAGWVASVLMLAYMIIYGLGLGMYYAPTTLLILSAAIAGAAPAVRGGEGPPRPA
jgi:hypothetical protein